MPGMPLPVDGEKATLLSFLDQQRHVLKIAAYGLTDEQAAAAPSVSPLSVGGLIKHVAATEVGWANLLVGDDMGESDYEGDFSMADGDTLASLIAAYDAVAARTTAIVEALPSLDHPIPVPQGVPWFPQDVEAWSARWVLLHIIEETCRHAGHADIVREHVDGATAFPLMAGAEGWPATPWMQPWQPPSD